MRAFITSAAIVVFAASSGLAQQQAASSPTAYSGYAYTDCTQPDTPTLRIVLPAGAARVPETIPKSAPRPAIELVIDAPVDRAVGGQLTVGAAGGAGLSVAGLSCPIVGDCSRAQSGTVSLQRRTGDGALTGEFGILWPDEAARQSVVRGKFVAAWLATPSTCK